MDSFLLIGLEASHSSVNDFGIHRVRIIGLSYGGPSLFILTSKFDFGIYGRCDNKITQL